MKLEDLRSKIGVMSDEDLLERIKEIRQNRRNFPEKQRKVTSAKTTATALDKMGTDELLKLLSILEGSEDDSA